MLWRLYEPILSVLGACSINFILEPSKHTGGKSKLKLSHLYSPVHLVQDLESLHLILLLYFFIKNAEKNTSGGLILYLQNFLMGVALQKA